MTEKPQHRGTVRDQVAVKLQDIDVPTDRIDDKIATSSRWWIGAGAFALMAIALLTGAAVAAISKDLPWFVAVVLCLPGAVSFFVALFCASQASGEVTKAFLETIGALLGRFLPGRS